MKTYHNHSTRAALTQSIPMPKCKKEITKCPFFHPTNIRSWNSLNPQCREAHTLPLSFMHWVTQVKPTPGLEPGSPAYEADDLPTELSLLPII